MNTNMETALFQAAVLTFEELGFLLATNKLDEDQRNAALDASVEVEFRGPFSGRLSLTLYGDLLASIAANMLGEDEPPAVSLQQDALREIGNVICGNALPLIAGKQEIFHLSPPQFIPGSASFDAAASSAPTAIAQIGLEQGRADVLLFVTSGPKSEEMEL